jgi:hypothetical protein
MTSPIRSGNEHILPIPAHCVYRLLHGIHHIAKYCPQPSFWKLSLFAATTNETELFYCCASVFRTPCDAESHRITAVGTLQRGR